MAKMYTVEVPMSELAEVIVLQLNNGGRAKLTVTGHSMRPMLRSRKDAVTLIPAQEQQKPGDVIFYQRDNGRYVLHRIIRKSAEGYICSGDNQYEEEPVAHRQVIAMVESFVRKGKTYSCDHLGYRLYVSAWVKLFFLRRAYIAVRRRLGHLRQRLGVGK